MGAAPQRRSAPEMQSESEKKELEDKKEYDKEISLGSASSRLREGQEAKPDWDLKKNWKLHY